MKTYPNFIRAVLSGLFVSCFLTLAAAQPSTSSSTTKAAEKATTKPPKSTLPAGIIGTVDLLSGTVTVTTIKGVPRDITVGMSLAVGDVIKTFDESEAHANMADGAYFAVRANSTIKITAYAANGNNRDRSWVDLVTGSLRTVTGWIAKTRPRNYRINTPTATIGVDRKSVV